MVLTAKKNQKIGLLGGTFDPIHNGHLAVASHVEQVLGLEYIWFIPAAQPPHKADHANGWDISSFHHRLAMLELALAQNSSFVVSDIEAQRSSPSYSIDTVNILLPQLGEKAEIFFIIGVDAFLEIATWKRYKELPTLVSFVVISRPTHPPDRVGEIIGKNFPGFAYDPIHEIWSSRQCRGSFILQHMEPVPISSTDIRMRVRKGKAISGMVPPPVEDYIRKHGLYT